MRAKTLFRVLVDASAPDSVGHVFLENRHEVIFHREVLPEGAPDPVVCAAALQHEAVLVAVDADMKRLTKRFGAAADSARFKKLDLIRVGCNGPLAAKRLEQAMELVRAEWAYAQKKTARRLFIDICPHFIKTCR